MDIVKLLVLRFPDCCEKVDDKGNNVLHLIVPKKGIFATSGLSNIRWLRVRGLMNEKSVEGKTPPLHLFRMSIISPEMMLTWILDTLVRLVRPPKISISYVSVPPLNPNLFYYLFYYSFFFFLHHR